MSRNFKSNLKNPPDKLMLKTTYNPRYNLLNENYLSPLHIKNNSNVTTDHLSFYANESNKKSNKKKRNGKINYFEKNYRINSINKAKERYIQTQTQSKKMSRNNSNKNDLLFNKTTFKNSFSTSKTNSNSLMISKKIKKKEKINNKIYKLLLKETGKNNKTVKQSNNKDKHLNKYLKNKSSNNIHITRKMNILNYLKDNHNNINNIKIKNNNNNVNTNNIKNSYITNNYLSYKKNLNNSIKHNSKNKTKNLNLTLNYIDKNNPKKTTNKILSTNFFETTKHKNVKNKLNSNLFHKTCINTPMETYRKKEQIKILNKEIENKTNEIYNLTNIVNEKDIYIKNLEEKISLLNVNQNVDKEYEKYSKIIIVKNIKNLTKENEQLHKQIQEYKNKEIKMMKLLQNIKNSGVDIDNILKQINSNENININLNSNNSNISEVSHNKYDDIALKTDTTNNTNITNNTFLLLNLNDEQKNISHKSCINLEQNLPELPLKNINDYFNENYFAKNENDNIQIQIINNNDCNILQK